MLFSFFHYTLPQHDIVRIVGTENRRIDFGENSFFWASPDVGTSAGTNRDVRFINAEFPNGKIIVYRNEDTGWGWPPYFKLDSSNLQAEAQALISNDKANPTWVSITHYGWRNEFFTIYPNAITINARSQAPMSALSRGSTSCSLSFWPGFCCCCGGCGRSFANAPLTRRWKASVTRLMKLTTAPMVFGRGSRRGLRHGQASLGARLVNGIAA